MIAEQKIHQSTALYIPNDLDFLVFEVSGPMSKENYQHFLKDRLTIAKLLKSYMFESVLRQKLVVTKNIGYDFTLRNTVHDTALLMPILNIFDLLKYFRSISQPIKTTHRKDTLGYLKIYSG